MKIDPELVVKLAKLARLDLDPEEQAAFATQIPKILAYVGSLQSVKIEPVATESPATTLGRPDVVELSPAVESMVAQAPARDGRFWKVDSVWSYVD